MINLNESDHKNYKLYIICLAINSTESDHKKVHKILSLSLKVPDGKNVVNNALADVKDMLKMVRKICCNQW